MKWDAFNILLFAALHKKNFLASPFLGKFPVNFGWRSFSLCSAQFPGKLNFFKTHTSDSIGSYPSSNEIFPRDQKKKWISKFLTICFQISDILFIVFCIPSTAVDYALTSAWPFGDIWCRLSELSFLNNSSLFSQYFYISFSRWVFFLASFSFWTIYDNIQGDPSKVKPKNKDITSRSVLDPCDCICLHLHAGSHGSWQVWFFFREAQPPTFQKSKRGDLSKNLNALCHGSWWCFLPQETQSNY